MFIFSVKPKRKYLMWGGMILLLIFFAVCFFSVTFVAVTTLVYPFGYEKITEFTIK